MMASLIVIVTSVTCLGIDYSHLVAVRTQLRNAADAAALAGAEQLLKAPDTCVAHAEKVAALNLADGQNLQDSGDTISVVAEMTPPTTTHVGKVTVTIEMVAKNLIAPMFAREKDKIRVVAVAGGAGQIVKTFQNIAFPLAVSLDALPYTITTKEQGKAKETAGGISLLEAINGDNKVFSICINSQTYKNGAFTSMTTKDANANWLKDAIAQGLGLEGDKYDPVTIPSAAIGDDIFLTNGVAGQKQLADDPFASLLMDGRTFVMPVISGDPAFNQTRKVIGFVTVVFEGITKNQAGQVLTLTARLVDAAVPGLPGSLATTGVSAWDAAIAKVEPQTVKLLQ